MGRVQGAVAQRAEKSLPYLLPWSSRLLPGLPGAGAARGGTDDTRRRAALAEIGEEARALGEKTGRRPPGGHRPGEATGRETVEVAHEALIRHWQRLQGWLNADREFLLWRQRLRHDLEDWQRTNRDEGALLRGASLAEAERWHTERAAHLTPGEREFIQASLTLREQERQTRRRRQRRRVLALASGLVAALVLLAFAWWQWRLAEGERRVSLSRQLAAQARSFMDGKLDLAILLSMEAWRVEKTVEAKRRALTALFRFPAQVPAAGGRFPGLLRRLQPGWPNPGYGLGNFGS